MKQSSCRQEWTSWIETSFSLAFANPLIFKPCRLDRQDRTGDLHIVILFSFANSLPFDPCKIHFPKVMTSNGRPAIAYYRLGITKWLPEKIIVKIIWGGWFQHSNNCLRWGHPTGKSKTLGGHPHIYGGLSRVIFRGELLQIRIPFEGITIRATFDIFRLCKCTADHCLRIVLTTWTRGI